MLGLDRLHNHIKKNRKVKRAKAEENGWVVSNIPTHLCIESWSLLSSIQWFGEAEL
jgi:hypothetical protein